MKPFRVWGSLGWGWISFLGLIVLLGIALYYVIDDPTLSYILIGMVVIILSTEALKQDIRDEIWREIGWREYVEKFEKGTGVRLNPNSRNLRRVYFRGGSVVQWLRENREWGRYAVESIRYASETADKIEKIRKRSSQSDEEREKAEWEAVISQIERSRSF